MSDSNVINLTQPGAFTDSLTEVLRSGARALLTQRLLGFSQSMPISRPRRPTSGPSATNQVAIRQPRVCDREAAEGARIRYSSSILP